MTENEVHENIVRWISSQTGLTTIKAHQSGNRPEKPYLMVNLLNVRDVQEYEQDVEFTELETENSAGNLEIDAKAVVETEWEFSIHSYGDNPTTALRKIKTRYKIQQAQFSLMPLLVIHDIGTINNVPDWVKNAWEPRSQCNLFVRGLVRDGVVIDVVEEASIGVTRGLSD